MASSSSSSSSKSDKMKTLKDAKTVMLHAEIKSLQLGAGAGLLIAIPGLSLAPMKFNPSDLPPLVSAASIAGTAAVTSLVVTIPGVISRLVKSGSEEIEQQAKELRENKKQRCLNSFGLIGAVTGLFIEGIRIRAVAKINDVPTTKVIATKQTLWESFCFSLVGSTLAVSTHFIMAFIQKKIGRKPPHQQQIEPDETRELNEATTTSTTEGESNVASTQQAVKESVDQAVEQASADTSSTTPNGATTTTTTSSQ